MYTLKDKNTGRNTIIIRCKHAPVMHRTQHEIDCC